MVVFKFVISEPKTRKTHQLEVDQDKAAGIIGKKIDDKFNADVLGLSGYEIQITGGTDKDGFPMHPKVHGPGRKRIVISGPPCFHPKIKGQRKRKTVRGNTISQAIVQVNCKVIKEGDKPLDQLIVKKEKKPEEAKPEAKEKKPEEKPKEEKKEELKKEEKPEEKKPKQPKEEGKQEEKSK